MAVLLLFVVTQTDGATTDWFFHATITSVDDGLTSVFSEGQTINGVFQYDTEVGEASSLYDDNVASWVYDSFSGAFSTSAGYDATLTGDSVFEIQNNDTYDPDSVDFVGEAVDGYSMTAFDDTISSGGEAVNGYALDMVYLWYSTTDTDVVEDFSLLTTAPDFSSFESKEFVLEFSQDGIYQNVVAVVDAIPEPVTVVSLLFGGGLIALVRRYLAMC